MNNTKIVYICGLGHNGSTSLDLLLDLSPNITGTSQLNDLLAPHDPNETPIETRTPRDKFWLEILEQLDTKEQQDLQYQNSIIRREKKLFSFFFRKSARVKYAQANEALIDVLASKLGNQTIVDSSKNITRCLGLLETKYDVRVIHLTRDVRGFVASHNKRRIENQLRPEYIKPTLLWYAKNTAASLMVKLKAKKYLRVRYEDYMFQPEQFLASVEKLIDVPLDDCRGGLLGKEKLRPSASLGFSGNRVLHNRKDFLLDRSRVSVKGLYLSRWYWLIAGWPAKCWGYSFRPKRIEMELTTREK